MQLAKRFERRKEATEKGEEAKEVGACIRRDVITVFVAECVSRRHDGGG